METQTIIKSAKRSISLAPGEIEDATQTLSLSFLSEQSGVNMWPGIGMVEEQIVVTPQSVDVTFLNNGAPLLLQHDTSNQIGVVDSAQIVEQAGRFVGRALVRFSPNNPEAVIVYKDCVQNIRQNVSCSYDILAYTQNGINDSGLPIMQATQIKVNEISIVSIPFDESPCVSVVVA